MIKSIKGLYIEIQSEEMSIMLSKKVAQLLLSLQNLEIPHVHTTRKQEELVELRARAKNDIEFLRFLESHLIPDVTYSLHVRELSHLGIGVNSPEQPIGFRQMHEFRPRRA